MTAVAVCGEQIVYDAGTVSNRMREQPWLLPLDLCVATALCLLMAAYVDGHRYFLAAFLLGLTQVADRLRFFNAYELLWGTTRQVRVTSAGIAQTRRGGIDEVPFSVLSMPMGSRCERHE